MIKVACAIIIKEEKILAAQRSETMDHPGKWEFPGGKIHPNESPEEAVVREIKEELAIEILPVATLPSIVYSYPDKTVHLIPILASFQGGDIKLLEHSCVRWIDLSELDTIDWAKADEQLVTILMDQPTLLDFE